MNQKKIGLFLKELRKEQNLTQEQLADKFGISSRSVSRWETGTNLPDLSILVELSDFYDIDIREIIDGERKEKNMNNETKETLSKVAEYAEQNTVQLKKKMTESCLGVMVLLVFIAVLKWTNGFNGFIAQRPMDNITFFTIGAALVILALNVLFYTEKLERVQNWKRKFLHKN